MPSHPEEYRDLLGRSRTGTCDEEELDLLRPPPIFRSTKSNVNFRPCGWTRRGVVLAVGGVLACSMVVVACQQAGAGHRGASTKASSASSSTNDAVHAGPSDVRKMVVVRSSCDFEGDAVCPLWSLLESPQIHEVATENLMRVGEGAGILEPGERHAVRAAVATGFLNISFELLGRPTPNKSKASSEFDAALLEVTRAQRIALLDAMRLLSDPEVRGIGQEVGQALYQADDSDAASLRSHLREALQPRLERLQHLRNDLMPVELQQMLGGGREWDLSLASENLHMMRQEEVAPAANQTTFGTVPRFPDKAIGILGGVLEEGRALLGLVHLTVREMPEEDQLHMSSLTSLAGNTPIDMGKLGCRQDATGELRVRCMQALVCELKFGLMGVEAMKAVYDMDAHGPFIPDVAFGAASAAAAAAAAAEAAVPVGRPE